MKKVSRRELARVAAQSLLDGKDAHRLMQELAAYLVEHKMTSQAQMLVDDIANQLEARTGHTTATVRTAFALSADSTRQLEEYVKQATGAKSVELTVQEDKHLLGGFVVRTPRFEYDASVRHKLNQLARGEK